VRRRRSNQPESLTSLLDCLFILIFAVLVHLAAMGEQARAAEPAVAATPVPPDADAGVAAPAPASPPAGHTALRQRALVELTRALEGRTAVVARVSPDGTLRALELGDRTVQLSVPLLERVPDPDIALAYLGDRSAELRVCRVAALRLGTGDLARYLVVIAPDVPLSNLTVALVAGLRRDAERCLAEQQGVAVVVDPAAASAPAEVP